MNRKLVGGRVWAKEFLMTASPQWRTGTDTFRHNIAVCSNESANLSIDQQKALCGIVSTSVDLDSIGPLNAMDIAKWINTCHD